MGFKHLMKWGNDWDSGSHREETSDIFKQLIIYSIVQKFKPDLTSHLVTISPPSLLSLLLLENT